jgi:hypothetical protein
LARRASSAETFSSFMDTGLSGGQFAAQVAAHAAAGGTLNMLQGGKFGHGFISAGATKALTPVISAATGTNVPVGAIASAVVGGTVSELSGGKFANGAAMSGFQYLFNTAVSRRVEGAITRRAKAVAELDRVKKFLDAFAWASPDHAALAFAWAGADVTNKYGYEVGAHIRLRFFLGPTRGPDYTLEEYRVGDTDCFQYGGDCSIILAGKGHPLLNNVYFADVHVHPPIFGMAKAWTGGFSVPDANRNIERARFGYVWEIKDRALFQFNYLNRRPLRRW